MAFLGLWLAIAAIGGSWQPSPIAIAVLLLLLAMIAWVADVTQFTLTLDCVARTYELQGGWPWSTIPRRGSFADFVRLRLEREQFPRRSQATLKGDGRWIHIFNRGIVKQWLVLYLDIQGNPNVSFQLQGSAVPPPQLTVQAEPAMRALLQTYLAMLKLPAFDLTG